MPQLDKISFFTQYFWLTIFFFAFYYFILNFFVIYIFKGIKLRLIINELYNSSVNNSDYDKGVFSFIRKFNMLYFSSVYYSNINKLYLNVSLLSLTVFQVKELIYKLSIMSGFYPTLSPSLKVSSFTSQLSKNNNIILNEL